MEHHNEAKEGEGLEIPEGYSALVLPELSSKQNRIGEWEPSLDKLNQALKQITDSGAKIVSVTEGKYPAQCGYDTPRGNYGMQYKTAQVAIVEKRSAPPQK